MNDTTFIDDLQIKWYYGIGFYMLCPQDSAPRLYISDWHSCRTGDPAFECILPLDYPTPDKIRTVGTDESRKRILYFTDALPPHCDLDGKSYADLAAICQGIILSWGKSLDSDPASALE